MSKVDNERYFVIQEHLENVPSGYYEDYVVMPAINRGLQVNQLLNVGGHWEKFDEEVEDPLAFLMAKFPDAVCSLFRGSTEYVVVDTTEKPPEKE